MEPEKSRCFQNNDNNCQDVVTLKIFDQCKIQECIPVGPAISREECDCIISPDCEISPGRIILAGCPVTVPPCTRAKIVKKSFRLSHVDILNVYPSPLKKGYWCADITFYFVFALQLFDMNMHPLKIICCPTTLDEMENNREEKFCLKAEVCYRKQVMLYGGERPSMQSFSNLFYTDQEFNDPYFLVQANAYVLNEMLKDPCRIEGKKDCSDPHCPPPCEPCCEPCCDPCCDSCCDSCCDAYCEPFFYLFLDVCLAGDVKLIRLACGEIQAKPCAESKPCDHCPEDDPRKIFNEMDFPNELFLPQK